MRDRWILILSILSGLVVPAGAAEVFFKDKPVNPERVLVRYRDDSGLPATARAARAAKRSVLLREQQLEERHRYGLVERLVLLELEPAERAKARVPGTNPLALQRKLEQRMRALQASGLFEYVEPDFVLTALAVPTDSRFTDGTLWGLRNTGQNNGVSGADINAPLAWDITTGSTNVVVGVIDSGVRYTHQDLSAQMWRNGGETPSNGIDDDGNGVVDDVFGLNAINGSGNPMDDNDHGTHCAGTIGAAANDGRPHVGVAWNVRIMALKFLDAQGSGSTADAIKCIDYGVAKGAKILSNSWGGGGFSQALMDAIVRARNAGVLFVAAAGNESADNDTTPSYPANYNVNNVISVASIDRQDKLSSFSNFGDQTVHVGAPGSDIFSTTSGNDSEYQVFSGTSMATPHVAGVAALILAQFPSITLTELRDRILNNVVQTAALRGKTTTGGRVDAFRALSAGASGDGILELTISPATNTTLSAAANAAFTVRVTDTIGLNNATVKASTFLATNLVFANNGVAPDTVAGDDQYARSIFVPAGSNFFALVVEAEAPGKTKKIQTFIYPVVNPPANDAFGSRITMSGSSVTNAGSNVNGSKEVAEPNHAGNAGGKSVWWSWTAPGNGNVQINTLGSTFDTLLGVYTGAALTSLVQVASDDDSGSNLLSLVSFATTAGVTYQLAVDGFNGAQGNVRIGLHYSGSAVGPTNDLFASRIVLSGMSNVTIGTTINATSEPGEPSHAGIGGGKSSWWSWTAPTSGTVTISTDGSLFDTVLGVYTGTTVSGLGAIASDNDSGEGTRSLVSFITTAGLTYQVAVDGVSGAAGSVALRIVLIPSPNPPVNDAFNSASALSGTNTTAVGTNTGATVEAGEPGHAGNAGGKSIWYSWVAPFDGSVTINTAGSGFDTLLAIYTGATVSALGEISSNDQDPLGGVTSRATFPVTSNRIYRIAVDGRNEGNGAVHGLVLLGLVAQPSGGSGNNNFANGITVSALSVTNSGNNTGYSLEAGEPVHALNAGGRSAWWFWQPASNFQVTVSTAGSDFDTLLAVYTGAAVNALGEITSNDNGPTGSVSEVTYMAVSGTTYRIAVDGFNGAAGTIRLRFTATGGGGAGAPNDNFIDAIPLVGSAVSATGVNVAATAQAGEPDHAGIPAGKSLWWTWTAPGDGMVEMDTAGSGFDTVLAVYTGATLSGLGEVASNDQEPEGGDTSLLSFHAVSGQLFSIALDGFFGDAGTGLLHIAFTADPVASLNDDFVDAELISGTSNCTSGVTPGATKEPSEPDHAGNGGGASLWYVWTAPTSGTFVFSTEASDFDTLLAAYSGTSLVELVEESSNDDFGGAGVGSRFSLFAAGGETYYLAVDGYDGDQGSFSLCWYPGIPPLQDGIDHPIFDPQLTAPPQAEWFMQADVNHDGEDALQSGFIFDGERTEVSIEVVGPGYLAFWWLVDSEFDFDFLHFVLNGVTNDSIAGTLNNWTNMVWEIPEGTNIVVWAFEKDGSFSEGLDAGWVDEVVFVPLVELEPVQSDLVRIRWPREGYGLELQSTTNLLPPTTWSPVSGIVTDDGLENSLIDSVATPDRTRTYRLRKSL